MNTFASVSLQITPLPYEVDFTGFVSNTVAPKWMERLRVLLMTQYFPEVDLKDPSNLSVISRVEVHYLRPIHFTDPIMGRAFISKVLSSSWVVGFSFTNMITSDVCFKGSQTGVFIDATTLKPKRMPSLINQEFKNVEILNAKRISDFREITCRRNRNCRHRIFRHRSERQHSRGSAS